MTLSLSTLLSLLSVLTISASFTPEQVVINANTACNGQALPPGVLPGSLSTNINTVSHGVPRSYRLHVPLGYNNTEQVPVYFSFHGATKSAAEQEGLPQFSSSWNPGSIAVYPEGLDIRGYWLSNPRVDASFPNDLDFILDLLAELESTLCIDTTRIYAAGKSNGGGSTNVIACNATVGPKFAAFAAVSGAYYNDDEVSGIGPCDPGTTHTPFLEFHGLQDCTAFYSGEQGRDPRHSQVGVPGFLSRWLSKNGCSAGDSPSSTSIFNQQVIHESWNCTGKNGVLQHYQENHLGHAWPSQSPSDDCETITKRCFGEPACPLGKFPNGFYYYDATPLIFDFFGQYSLPGSRN